uniref:transcription antitermination protein NusB n=1 Tax=uncultured Enorma sp. TaxID=1714346 RepID=UPI0025FB7299
MTELSPARRVALDILLELEETGAYARDALDASPDVHALERRDAGLAMRLVLGVVASYGCLDDLIDAYCDKPGRMNARIRNALRVATFELVYLGTEPRAAVSQGVELVRTRAKSAAGFANFVLRRIAENRAYYLEAGDVGEPEERRLVALARQGGLPIWLP